MSQDYPWIRKWGHMMGSFAYYIHDELYKARKHGAPENAIYYNKQENKWRTIDDITCPITRMKMGLQK